MAKLGIHTHVPDPDKPNSTHAWLSIEREGQVITYGLYGSGQASQQNGQGEGWNGSGTHIRQNLELGRDATASRFKIMTVQEEAKLVESLNEMEI